MNGSVKIYCGYLAPELFDVNMPLPLVPHRGFV